jgi:Uma2 family endonuclease
VKVILPQLAKHLITADEYERMGEAGVFHPDDRLELVEGEIYEMSPTGSRHAACVKILSRLLHRLPGDTMIVSTQDPIRLNDFSEPQPDVALLRWRDDFYRQGHPQPSDVLLVIEVADTTVETDRAVKLPLYAAAGIPEVWLINLPDESVEVYAGPSGGAYQSAEQFRRGAEARAETLPGLAVSVADLLG